MEVRRYQCHYRGYKRYVIAVRRGDTAHGDFARVGVFGLQFATNAPAFAHPEPAWVNGNPT